MSIENWIWNSILDKDAIAAAPAAATAAAFGATTVATNYGRCTTSLNSNKNFNNVQLIQIQNRSCHDENTSNSFPCFYFVSFVGPQTNQTNKRN